MSNARHRLRSTLALLAAGAVALALMILPAATAAAALTPADAVTQTHAAVALAETGSDWQVRFAMLAIAGLAVIFGIVAIIAKLDLRARRGTRG